MVRSAVSSYDRIWIDFSGRRRRVGWDGRFLAGPEMMVWLGLAGGAVECGGGRRYREERMFSGCRYEGGAGGVGVSWSDAVSDCEDE